MKKLFLLIGLVVFYSLNSLGDATDDKLKRKYNELKEKYPSGYEIYCRYEKTTGTVKWDWRRVYYIDEKSEKIFYVWSTEEYGIMTKNSPDLLINLGKPVPIDYSSNDVVVWHIGDVYLSYHKKTKDLIVDYDDDKYLNLIHWVRVKKHRMRIMPDDYWLMNCAIKYKWP